MTLVSTVPLPATRRKRNRCWRTSPKEWRESLPKPEEKVEPEAIAIPDKDVKDKKPKPKAERHPTASRNLQPVEQADNVVPFGQGGPVSGPYGTFSADGAKGGFGFTGGGGDFGSRYSWYVRVVQQKVSENWQKYEVDPSISTAQRVYMTFDVMRDGHPANVQVEQVKRCSIARSIGDAGHSAY